MIRHALIVFISLSANFLSGQAILDQYVREAIQHNLEIKGKQLLEQKQVYSLQEAKKGYAPDVNFLTSYTVADGGRTFDLPVGSLLNDVYSTLNDKFGTDFHLLKNQSIQFLPNNYYDTRLRITQPVLQPEVKYNKRIKQEELNLAGLATDQTTRDLVRDVKTTYLQWKQAHDAIEILNQGLSLLAENKRITESLIKNGAGLPSALIRIQSEITTVEAQKQKASSDLANAAAYFNFLLARPAESSIESDSFPGVPEIKDDLTIAGREELQQIKSGNRLQGLAMTLEEKHFAPRLGVQVDVGSQEFVPNWGGYFLGGVQLEVPIWDNKKSKLRRQAWASAIASGDAQYEWTRSAFEIQLQNEQRSLVSDLAVYESYTQVLTSNQRYYDETLKRYREGLANYIELLDARTEITNARLQQNIAKYQAWIRQANIERISASASIQ